MPLDIDKNGVNVVVLIRGSLIILEVQQLLQGFLAKN